MTLTINDFTVETNIAFSNEDDKPIFPVLGHIGFFEHFKVLFDYPRKFGDVKPSKSLIDEKWDCP